MAIEFRVDEVFEVGPGVWIRNMVDNAAWADLGDGVAVIDTLDPADDAAMEKQLPEDIRRTTGKPIRWIVNTHWHPDHIGFNASWAREFSAPVIAHESCGAAQPEHNGQPNVTFRDTYTLSGSERSLEMEFLGGTHTPWDSVVYFPWARVLHIADLFGWGMIPLVKYEAAKLDLLRRHLNRVLEYDADTYIVGHGPVAKPEHIRRWLSYLDELMERVPPLARAGSSLDDIEAQVGVPADMQEWWKLPDWKHRHNLQLIAREFGG